MELWLESLKANDIFKPYTDEELTAFLCMPDSSHYETLRRMTVIHIKERELGLEKERLRTALDQAIERTASKLATITKEDEQEGV